MFIIVYLLIFLEYIIKNKTVSLNKVVSGRVTIIIMDFFRTNNNKIVYKHE